MFKLILQMFYLIKIDNENTQKQIMSNMMFN